jgi:glycerol-3-phosphate responsive antiterminator
MKKDSSGRTGDNIGSAIPPIVDLMPGFIISKVIKIMTISIIIIEPPGG